MVQKQLASPETIKQRFGSSWEEVARLVDQHTMAVQAWLSTRAPDVEYFNGSGIRAGSTDLGARLFNLALGCNFPPGTDDQTIEAEIEELKQFYARRGVKWMWWVGPFPQPADLAERLARQGIGYDRPGLPAMAAPLPTVCPPLNPEVKVWQAASRGDLEAASRIRRIAFRFGKGAALSYFEDMAEDWLNGDPARLYLARLGDGPPAAIGALITGAGLAGVYIMATLPEWGRRGLGKAIMARLVAEATAARREILILTAGDMGYPLYQKFGFEHIFYYKVFEPVAGR